MKTPHVLLILDGWGHSQTTNHNAIAHAHTPNWDRLWHDHPHTLIQASGQYVGLPAPQMGNSEVGHVNIGSGRIVYQELTRIDKAIADGAFESTPALKHAVDQAVEQKSALHLMGLLSPGGVHSHERHLFAMIDFAVASGVKSLYVHAFLDGRDTPPKSAESSLNALQQHLTQHGVGQIATISGRYFAMDRDNRWDRIEKAYHAIIHGQSSTTAPDAITGLTQSYAIEQTDEFVTPTVIGQYQGAHDQDQFVFMNFRADRARELSYALTQPDFDGFQRLNLPNITLTTLTQYDVNLDAAVAFPPESLTNLFGQVLSDHGKTQLRIAETEKYAHVTFFFNGGREVAFEGETRQMIPSPNVATYDQQPEMSAPALTDALVKAIGSGQFDTIIGNYANADMVGHTGNFQAAVQAVEALDECLGRVIQAIEKTQGHLFVTADHGNADQMIDPDTGKTHTAHTSNPVPFVYYGPTTATPCCDEGRLCDIAPTMLKLMNLQQPVEMTGHALFDFQ